MSIRYRLCDPPRSRGAKIFVGWLLAAVILIGRKASAEEPKEAQQWSTRLSFDMFAYGKLSILRDTEANPGSEMARIPTASAGAELRPDLRADYGDWARLVFRPRFTARFERIHMGHTDSNQRTSDWLVNTLYLQVTPTPMLILAYGRQSFEWGNAEFVNASNRLFHINALQKDPLYLVHGRELARAGLFLGRQWSVVVLVELRDNGDRPFGESTFDRKGLIKIEFASESGARRVGLVGGTGVLTVPWLGFYGGTELFDGFSLHTDLAVSRGSHAWRPVEGPDGVEFQRPGAQERRPELLGVVGGKYTTLFGLELGLEYVANTAGYSGEEIHLAYQAVTTLSPQLAANIQTLGNTGLEVIGRHYLYALMRWPSMIARWEVNVGAGYLRSFTDGSGRGLLYADVSLARSLVAFASGSFAHGAPDAELAAFSSVLGGLRHTW